MIYKNVDQCTDQHIRLFTMRYVLTLLLLWSIEFAAFSTKQDAYHMCVNVSSRHQFSVQCESKQIRWCKYKNHMSSGSAFLKSTHEHLHALQCRKNCLQTLNCFAIEWQVRRIKFDNLSHHERFSYICLGSCMILRYQPLLITCLLV